MKIKSGLSSWHEKRFEEIKNSETSDYKKCVALANLMTTLEHENNGNSVLNIQESPLGEFYRKVKKLRDELE